MGLAALASVMLAACGEPEDTDSGGQSWQPTTGATGGGTAGATGGGATGGLFPGNNADAGVVFPGMMPVIDGSVFGPPDSGVGPRPDASLPDGSTSSPRPDAGPVSDISSCTPPPAGATETAIKAWRMLNEIRLPAGAGCINMVPELITSAQKHCDYKAMNRSNASCTPDAHTEVSGCAGFTGRDVQSREIAAGYPRNLAYTEVALTYGNNPEASIPGWLVTPFHRIPMIDPWTTDMGWGGGPSCDVIDFGRGTVRPPDSTVVVFPYNGQIGVPTSFNGLEAPQPPPPASGWPSSYPISVYAQRLTITEHVLTKDGDPTPLDHLWLDTQSPGVPGLRPYFGNTALMYGAPFQPNTKYRVKLVGTYVGGALNMEWTFTTGASRPAWF